MNALASRQGSQGRAPNHYGVVCRSNLWTMKLLRCSDSDSVWYFLYIVQSRVMSHAILLVGGCLTILVWLISMSIVGCRQVPMFGVVFHVEQLCSKFSTWTPFPETHWYKPQRIKCCKNPRSSNFSRIRDFDGQLQVSIYFKGFDRNQREQQVPHVALRCSAEAKTAWEPAFWTAPGRSVRSRMIKQGSPAVKLSGRIFGIQRIERWIFGRHFWQNFWETFKELKDDPWIFERSWYTLLECYYEPLNLWKTIFERSILEWCTICLLEWYYAATVLECAVLFFLFFWYPWMVNTDLVYHGSITTNVCSAIHSWFAFGVVGKAWHQSWVLQKVKLSIHGRFQAPNVGLKCLKA